MNKQQIIIAVFLTFFFGACQKDFLDTKPLDQYSDADFWKDPTLGETFVNSIYRSLIPDDGFYDDECVTNNAEQGIGWCISHDFNKNGWTATYVGGKDRQWFDQYTTRGSKDDINTFTQWQVLYREIRMCNIAVNNLVKTKDQSVRLNQLYGEALFLRAYKYHELVRKYGGIILLDKALSTGDELNRPRNTYKECVDFIVEDCNNAEKALPEKWDNGNTGRATKGAALALKGRMQLYAGRWAESAETYKKLIDNKNAYTYGLYPDFKQLFLRQNENNQEVIFDVQFIYPDFPWTGHFRSLPGSMTGWGAASPSQNLVDQFELKDGKAWNDKSSPYYDELNPWANREPRFYATILHDQGVYLGKRLETGTGLDGNGNLIKGVDIEKANDVTATAYYMGKFADTNLPENPYIDGTSSAFADQNVILIRFAEVLLGYAEAQNESIGPDATVYNAVNEVRARVNLPGLPQGLSKDEMRRLIRKERRVELSFEMLYVWDLIRWRAIDQLTEPIGRAFIDYTYELNEDGSVKVDETSRKVIKSRKISYGNLDARIFNLGDDFNWFFPIPQTEIDKNPNLKQNGEFADEIR